LQSYSERSAAHGTEVIKFLVAIRLFHGLPSFVISHIRSVLEHIGALGGAVDSFVAFLAAEAALLGRLFRAINTAMTLLTTMPTVAGERTIDALVSAISLGVTTGSLAR
jgi:hypothetical protein